MIHQLLNITRPIIFVDVESTGTDVLNDRIVELGFQVWDATGLTKEWHSLINPGIPIPTAASDVHKITDELVQSCRVCKVPEGRHMLESEACSVFKPWPTFAQLAPNLPLGFSNCDYAGQNVRFDLKMLASEFARANIEWNYSSARIVDSSRLEALGEPRSLSALYEKHTGQKLDGAHGAATDVEASRMVIEAQLKRYQMLPRDLSALHEAQWPGWLGENGSFKMINGVATCQFGKYRGKAMNAIPNDYWGWIITKSDFGADVKALAKDAKLGRFPGAQ